MDNLTSEQRRKNMQAIKSKDTIIELMIRRELWKQGIRYRKNYTKLAGKPDIVITKYKIAIFCDSDFWHGRDWNNNKNKIKSNTEYWIPKIEKNIAKDKENNKLLEDDGWVVIRLWEKDIRKTLPECISSIKKAIDERSK